MADDPRVRIGHCSPDAPSVDIEVDGTIAVENVSFGDVSDYESLPAGEHTVAVMPAGGGDAVITADLDLAADSSYTALAVGMLDDIEIMATPDRPGDVPADKSHIRFVHASPDAPDVSIGIRDGPEVFTDIGFGSASDYKQVDAGSYDLDVMPAGSDDVVLSLDGTEFDGENAYTAVAIGRVADDSLRALLVEDAGEPIAAGD